MAVSRVVVLAALAALALLSVAVHPAAAQNNDATWTMALTGQDSYPTPDPATYRDYLTQWSSVYSGASFSLNMPVESSLPGVTSLDVEAIWTDRGTESNTGSASSGTFADPTKIGVPSMDIYPPGLGGASYWSGSDGNFYIYGGFDGTAARSELWRFDPNTRMYTQMNDQPATPTEGQAPVYGTRAVAGAWAASNPGSRSYAATATAPDQLWLIGGYAVVGSATTGTQYGDIWFYTISTGQWTWQAGTNTPDEAAVLPTVGGTASGSTTAIGARQDATAWYASGKLFIFGGQRLVATVATSMGDLWSYEGGATDQFTYLIAGTVTDTNPAGTAAPMFRVGGAGAVVKETILVLIGGLCTPSDASAATYTNDIWTVDSAAPTAWTFRGGSVTQVSADAGHASYTTLRVPAAAVGQMPGRWRAAVAVDADLIYLYGGEGSDSTGPTVYLKDVWTVDMSTLATPVQTWVGGQSYQDSTAQTDTEYNTSQGSDYAAYGYGVTAGVAFVDKYHGYWYGFGDNEAGLMVANDLFYIRAVARTLKLELHKNDGSGATIVYTPAYAMDDNSDYPDRWISNARTVGDTLSIAFTITDGTDTKSFTLTMTWVAALGTTYPGYSFDVATTPTGLAAGAMIPGLSQTFTVPYVSTGTIDVIGSYDGAGGLFDDNDVPTPYAADFTPWKHKYTLTGGSTSTDSYDYYVYTESGLRGVADLTVAFADPPSADASWSAEVNFDGDSTYYSVSDGSTQYFTVPIADAGQTVIWTVVLGDPTHATFAQTSGTWSGTDGQTLTATVPATAGACSTAGAFTVTAQDTTTKTTGNLQVCVDADLSFSAAVVVPGCGVGGADFTATWTSSSSSTQQFPKACAGVTATYTFTPGTGSTLTDTTWTPGTNVNVYSFALPTAGSTSSGETFRISSPVDYDSYSLYAEVLNASSDKTWIASVTSTLFSDTVYSVDGIANAQTISVPRAAAGAAATWTMTTFPSAATYGTTCDTAPCTITTTTYNFDFAQPNQNVVITLDVVAEDLTSTVFTVTFATVPSTSTSWSASLTGGSIATQSFSSGDAFGVDNSQTLTVVNAAAGTAGTITFSSYAPATFDQGAFDIKTATYGFTFLTGGNDLTLSLQLDAEDTTTKTAYVIVIHTTASTTTSWSASLQTTSATYTFDSNGGDGTTQTITVTRDLAGAATGSIVFNNYSPATIDTTTGAGKITATPFAFTYLAAGQTATFTITFIAQDTTTTKTYTIKITVPYSTDASWTADLASSGLTPGMQFSSAGSTTTQKLTVPRTYADAAATLTFNKFSGAAFSTGDITISPFTFNFPDAAHSSSFTVRVVAEDGSTTLGTYSLTVAVTGSADASWTATVNVGSWTSDLISSGGSATKNVAIPYSARDWTGTITVTKATGSTFDSDYESSDDISYSPYPIQTAVAGDVATYFLHILAEDGTTTSIATFTLTTDTTPVPDGGSTGTNNGGASEGTNFTVTATVGSFSTVVRSNDYPTDTVTVNLPASAGGVNCTLVFAFPTGAYLSNSNGATIWTNPTVVKLPVAGSSTTYSIHVQNDRGDNHDYSVKVVVAAPCVGSQCAASTLMQLSLPLAILLFLFGRKAAQQ